MSKPDVRGFTLVELLVALFITALLFAMGYGSLTEALNSRKEVEEQGARLAALQQTMRVMEQDIELLQPRPARDPLGNGFQSPLVAGQNTTVDAGNSGDAGADNATVDSGTSNDSSSQSAALLTLTRGSWTNPAGLPRSELERVSYLVRNGRLVRQNLPVMDTTAATAVVERELLDQVVSISFRYMDESMSWSPTWPTAAMQAQGFAALVRARPVAVEITLTLKDLGVIKRIIEVSG